MSRTIDLEVVGVEVGVITNCFEGSLVECAGFGDVEPVFVVGMVDNVIHHQQELLINSSTRRVLVVEFEFDSDRSRLLYC